MKLLITFADGHSETHLVENIKQLKNHLGEPLGIVTESFHRTCHWEPKRPTQRHGVESMQLFF